MLVKCQKVLKNSLNAFRRSDEGSMSVEAILVTPLLLTSVMLSYGWFTAFDAKARANKAAYTISDYVTRQTDAITPEFIEGLGNIYRFLNNEGDIALRVSSVRWSTSDDEDGDYELLWSAATGTYSALEDADISDISERLPILTDGGEVIVVETVRPWTAPFNVGLGEVFFSDFVTTTPRFSTQIAYDDGSDEGGAGMSDDPDVDGEWDGTYWSGGGRWGSHY
ncbi:TadE/TadG family type IV pilus assembly protein [Celeribacter sp.]|uniref:TadE/TadG family type IV pilus assembly protein n=1 Tax=Celeribacter sp. TaxID=1890673 RepID=UPI003A910633